MLNYFTPFTIFELTCLLAAFVALIRDPRLYWKGMCVYLLAECIAEFTGIYLKRHHHSNGWPYDILLIFQITFISFMFYGLLRTRKDGKWLLTTGTLILAVLYCIDLFQHGFARFYTLTFNTMSVVFVIYSLFYFFVLIKKDEYIKLQTSAAFWWVVGVLFFYFGDTAVNVFRGKLAVIKITENHALPYYILICLNIILYLSWSYSFICRKWLTKRSET